MKRQEIQQNRYNWKNVTASSQPDFVLASAADCTIDHRQAQADYFVVNDYDGLQLNPNW
jgi:hypothetical protein